MSILEGQAGDFDEDERSSLESMAFTASVDHILLLFPDLNDSGISINSDSTVGSSESSDGVEAESDENSVQLGVWFLLKLRHNTRSRAYSFCV